MQPHSQPVSVSKACWRVLTSAETVPVQIINRFCSSGLMACGTIANQIRNGEIDIGLAVGYESMTNK